MNYFKWFLGSILNRLDLLPDVICPKITFT